MEVAKLELVRRDRGRYAIIAIQCLVVALAALGSAWFEASWPIPILVGGACVVLPETGFAWILGRLESAKALVACSVFRFVAFAMLCAGALYAWPTWGIGVVMGVCAAVVARMVGALVAFRSSFARPNGHD